MTDDSKFVLRWEIDNVAARSATGRMESGVFDKGGFQWTIEADRVPDPSGRNNSGNEMTKFTLTCNMDRNRSWQCEAEIEMYILYASGQRYPGLDNKTRFCFDKNMRSFEHRSNDMYWCYFTQVGYGFINNDKVTVEFVVNIISSDRGKPIFDPIKFDSPNNKSNVILVIGDKRLHVSKEYLAINSPVFDTMFFGDFVENGKGEVEIKDVIYEEFIDLLYMIYPGQFKITDATVFHLLALSDRFQIEHIRYPAEEHLRNSKKFTTAQKLAVADKYGLNDLRDYCLHTYKSTQSFGDLESAPEYSSFSADMKAAICDRVMKLIKDKK